MQYVKCDVSTICVGLAASMGAFLLSAGAKGKRFALPNAEIMIHQPLIGGDRGIGGQCSDVQIAAQNMQRSKDRLNRILAENTGKSFEEVERDTDRNNWLTAEEAMNYGLIDQVIQNR